MSKQTDLSLILDGIEERANAATPPPWVMADESIITQDNCIAVIESDGGYECDADKRLANQDFIAASRTDVPALAKALRLSIAQLESMKVNCSFDIKGDPYELENQGVTGTLSAIAAILQPSSDPKEA